MTRKISSRVVLGLAVAASISLSACRGDGANNETDTTPASTNDTTASAGTVDRTAPMSPANTANATMSDANIVAKLAAMDSAEIELGHLGTSKARSGDVKAFARMMIDHHGQMKTEGTQMAAKEGITPVLPPSDPTAREMVTARDRLLALDAASFDRAYMEQMVADHQKAVATIESMMGMAQHPGLKAHLEAGLPRVRAHLDQAMKLQQSFAGTTPAGR